MQSSIGVTASGPAPLRIPATPVFSCHRLSERTFGMVCGFGQDRQCIALPVDATIQVLRETREPDHLIPVKWQGQLVMMFTVDFQRNAARVEHPGPVDAV